jgi:hypothetical protein
MSYDQNHDDWLADRLRALGAQPIDPATQSQHLTAIATAAVDQAQRSTLLGRIGRRIQVGAALVAGVLLGTTGLATAGALGPLQPIAAKGVEAVTPLDVPDGRGKSADAKAKAKATGLEDDANGVERVTEGCEAGISTRNRGQYLKGIREKYGADSAELAAAKASRCGMPVNSEGTPGGDDGAADAETKASKADEANKTDADGTPHDAGDGKGKPEGTPGGKPDGTPASGKRADGAPRTAGKPAGTPGAVDDASGTCAGGPGFVPSAQPDCASGS